MKALITGASSGIGRSLAKELKQRGYEVAISARRTAALQTLADEIGGAIILPADLSQPGEAQKLGARALEALGSIDVLVNNAGVGVQGAQEALADNTDVRAMFETNYWSPLALTRAIVPSMRGRKSGAVVNVSSLASITPLPHHGHYSATKGAFALATETLRMELQGSGIHVLHVLPGPVETAMYQRARDRAPKAVALMNKSPTGNPDVLAKKIADALEKKRDRIVYPSSLAIVRRFPNFALWVTQKLAPRYLAALEA